MYIDNKGFQLLVGIDWGTKEHQVCLMDATGQVLGEHKVKNTGTALVELADQLVKRAGGNARLVAVAIETPTGPVVETMVERGIAVFAINPKQLDRFRDRHTVAGAKDDRRDALVLADSLRTDLRAFTRVILPEATVIELREQVRLHDELGEEFVRLSNRLRELLLRYHLQALELNAVDEEWFWDVLTAAPTPEAAHSLLPVRVERILKSHRIRRYKATQVLKTLRAPAVTVAPGVAEAASAHVRSLLARLRLVHQQTQQCDRTMARLLEGLCKPPPESPSGDAEPEGQKCEHRDAKIVLTLAGVGTYVAAAMLAEAPQALAERDYHALRLLGGCAPVTRQTGKQSQRRKGGPKPHILMRRACNGRLRNAFHFMALSAIRVDPRARQLYADARARGHTCGCALRIVADRHLAVLIAMLRTGTAYDVSRRQPPPGDKEIKAVA